MPGHCFISGNLYRFSDLQKLIGQYIDACARYLRVEATLVETVDEDRYEHRALLDATLAGDVHGAMRLIERHVAGTANEIAEVLRNRDRVKPVGPSLRSEPGLIAGLEFDGYAVRPSMGDWRSAQ